MESLELFIKEFLTDWLSASSREQIMEVMVAHAIKHHKEEWEKIQKDPDLQSSTYWEN